ncbi:MAG: hypothetical protein COY40_01340 [Alphaproteobacteria bacterium CG_4_10_14_0_8_um_filter_53_9]|nr:MAG: hypothetical protein COY40_01340 [Alphaproteobacteria bacterium CG_4_10_14_0_8_um_filter_53_9]
MQSLTDFFDLADSHELCWRHGVVTPDALTAACEDVSLHVAVVSARFTDDDATPMAGTLTDATELDMATALFKLNRAGKAIKIDFLEPCAVIPVLEMLARLKPDVPVILHANIFALLPHSKRDEGIAPEAFFAACHQWAPRAIISLGWSLKRSHDDDGRLEESLIEQLADMTRHHLPTAAYALEIRAGYTSGIERGAAFIFDPVEPSKPARSEHLGANVVDASGLFGRQTAAA